MATFGVGPNPYEGEETATKKVSEDRRYIEDDIKVLQDIDKEIDKLLSLRNDRMASIKEQHEKNYRVVQDREDWFQGSVMGRPVVPERDTVAEYPRDYR